MLWSKLINDDALSELMLLLRAKISKASFSSMKLDFRLRNTYVLVSNSNMPCYSYHLSCQSKKLVRLSQQPYHLAQRKLPNWWRPGRQSIFDPPGFVICREKSYCWKCNLYYCYIFLYFFCQVPTRNCMCIFYSYSSLSCWCLSICHCLRETSSVLLLTSWPQGP
jgi:hypothetical protein